MGVMALRRTRETQEISHFLFGKVVIEPLFRLENLPLYKHKIKIL